MPDDYVSFSAITREYDTSGICYKSTCSLPSRIFHVDEGQRKKYSSGKIFLIQLKFNTNPDDKTNRDA